MCVKLQQQGTSGDSPTFLGERELKCPWELKRSFHEP